jgi:hypothetical protein
VPAYIGEEEVTLYGFSGGQLAGFLGTEEFFSGDPITPIPTPGGGGGGGGGGDLTASFTQATINAAMDGSGAVNGGIRYWRPTGGSYRTEPYPVIFQFQPGWDDTGILAASAAMHYLALVAYHDPTATSTTSGNDVAEQVASAVEQMVASGREPWLNGMYGWCQPMAAATLLLARNTTAVWDQVSTDARDRADFLMKIYAVTGNYMHNYAHGVNNVGQRLSVDLGRNGAYLPNQRGYAASMSYAYAWFGGATAVNAILAAFDWDDYIAQMTAYGWTDIRGIWQARAQVRQQFEGTLLSYTNTSNGAINRVTAAGVTIPFTMAQVNVVPTTGVRSTGSAVTTFTPQAIFDAEDLGYTWGLNVMTNGTTSYKNDPTCTVTGHLVGGAPSFTGDLGMAYEFGANPEGRSSLHYSYFGSRIAQVHLSTMASLGYLATSGPSWDQACTALEHFLKVAAIQGWYQADAQGRCARTDTAESYLKNFPTGYIYMDDIYSQLIRPASIFA